MLLQQSERELQNACTDLLQYYENTGKLLFIRNNSFAGKITRKNGSEGFIKNNKPGAPDLIIFLPNGQTLSIELKSFIGSLSKEQIEWSNTCTRLNQTYHVVRSLEYLEKLLKLHVPTL